MKIGLIGSSYQQRSLPFDAQRMVNLFPISDPEGSDVAALYGTPGLSLFCVAGSGTIRGCMAAANLRSFVVSGAELYEIDSAGTSTLRGTLSTTSGIVTIADNGLQLAICDGSSVYILTYATNVFAQVTDVDLPSAKNISFVDGYFIVTKNNSGQFYISALYDGTSWNALDFATAESSPDNLSCAVPFVGQLGLLGHDTLEIWRNTGDSSFPFARISGSTPIGTIAPNTVISLDTSVYWVGNTAEGSGIVYQAQGFTPKRISTDAIELILQKEPNPELLRTWGYQQEGHVFLVITGGSLETSLVYDLATGLWHERAFLNSGVWEQHLGACAMYAFNKQLIGDRRNGNVYSLSLDIYSDNGAPIKRQRIYTHLNDEGKRIRYNKLNIGFEVGGLPPTYMAPAVGIPASLDTDYRTIAINALLSAYPTAYFVTFSDVTAYIAGKYYLNGHNVTFSGVLSPFGGVDPSYINKQQTLIGNALSSGGIYTFSIPVAGSFAGCADTVTVSSGLLAVNATAHGMSDGDRIIISGAVDTAGLTAAQINGTYSVFNTSTNKFYIMTTGTATSAVTGGGGAFVTYQRIYNATEATAILEISGDGGRTWSSEFTKGLGAQGDYKKFIAWRRLGIDGIRTFRLTISDAAKVSIAGSYLTV